MRCTVSAEIAAVFAVRLIASNQNPRSASTVRIRRAGGGEGAAVADRAAANGRRTIRACSATVTSWIAASPSRAPLQP